MSEAKLLLLMCQETFRKVSACFSHHMDFFCLLICLNFTFILNDVFGGTHQQVHAVSVEVRRGRSSPRSWTCRLTSDMGAGNGSQAL